VVHSTLECKFWLVRPPSAEEVRPARCPACQGAGREVGRVLSIVGHGLRDRQQRGPPAVDAAPMTTVVAIRRYRCRRCRAVLVVVPREVEPRRHYSRPAIALALARRGLLDETSAQVRRAISAWQIAATAGWRTLRRWITAVRRGVLFPVAAGARAMTDGALATRVAQIALGHAPPTMRGASMLAQVFAGAAAMA
jgi:hypothetical protein